MLRGFDKILRDTNDFNLANVESLIAGFLKEVELTSSLEIYQDGKLLKHRYEDLLTASSANASMFKQKLEALIRDFPQVRSEIDLSIFEKMTTAGVKVSVFNGVIFVD